MDTELVRNILTGAVSVIALAISLYTYKIARREQRYADLDVLYQEVLRLGMEYPKFRNPRYTKNYKEKFRNEDELCRYESYAYIVWNICETICDRKDSAIFETWKPVITAENKLHRRWFDNPENHHKFKERFRTYIAKNFPKEYVDKASNERKSLEEEALIDIHLGVRFMRIRLRITKQRKKDFLCYLHCGGVQIPPPAPKC